MLKKELKYCIIRKHKKLFPFTFNFFVVPFEHGATLGNGKYLHKAIKSCQREKVEEEGNAKENLLYEPMKWKGMIEGYCRAFFVLFFFISS